MTFKELHLKLTTGSAQVDTSVDLLDDSGIDQLSCLFDPNRHPPLEGEVKYDPSKITSKDTRALMEALPHKKGMAFAMIAPAFLGQFSPAVTPGKLRAAFRKMGLDGMLEVSLFADILTLKEALEFDKNIQTEEDFQLTSCCCPMWLAMIRKQYAQLMPHVPASVSPMVACGRVVKKLYPDALTVFIGPCIAKKAEAREKDVAGAVDYVLTFEEVDELFQAMELDLAELEEIDKEFSSRAGRIYARSGGVSEAVRATLARLNPNRRIGMVTMVGDGVPGCRALMNQLASGVATANFYEGMGCVGGCVGGPKAIISMDQGRKNVNQYGDHAHYDTPIDNPYIIELLHRLGFDTVDSLLEENELFSRNFDLL